MELILLLLAFVTLCHGVSVNQVGGNYTPMERDVPNEDDQDITDAALWAEHHTKANGDVIYRITNPIAHPLVHMEPPVIDNCSDHPDLQPFNRVHIPEPDMDPEWPQDDTVPVHKFEGKYLKGTYYNFKPNSTYVLQNGNVLQIPDRPDWSHAVIDGIFDEPISIKPPMAIYQRNSSHPIKKWTMTDGATPTNKFYTNMMVDERKATAFVLPYQLRWNQGLTEFKKYGMTISQTTLDQRQHGPNGTLPLVQYYLTPTYREDLVLSAKGYNLGEASFNVYNPTDLSATAALQNPTTGKEIKFPMCQGMGFVTALFDGDIPEIHSNNGFSELLAMNRKVLAPGVTRYMFRMSNAQTWLAYETRTIAGGYSKIDTKAPSAGLKLTKDGVVVGTTPFHGMLQIAKLPYGIEEDSIRVYDLSAGVYCTGVKLDGAVDGIGNLASYTLEFQKEGIFDPACKDPTNRCHRPLLMFALAHQITHLMTGERTALVFESPAKGPMIGVRSDIWIMLVPNVPNDIGFGPYRRDGKPVVYSPKALAFIRQAAIKDLEQDHFTLTDQESWYYSGKSLTKLAQICWVTRDVLHDAELEKKCVDLLKRSFVRYQTNNCRHKLIYDEVWGGLVSDFGYTDLGADFGNTGYNDHHFHYGYHVYPAAVLTYLDPTWLTPEIKEYIEGLIRDFANPSSKDPFFTPHRSFDWYHGHSWAKGVFESADGKDQESASEDYFAAYSLKLWATVTSDPKMWSRATLMLGLLRQTNRIYFQIQEGTLLHDPKFREHLIAGILFEGKIDYTTYFGTASEYIHGISMLPLHPMSPYMRGEDFVKREYEKFFRHRIWEVDGGWKGILRANQALYDPKPAWEFFTSGECVPEKCIDNGASITYYLALIAAWGGEEVTEAGPGVVE